MTTGIAPANGVTGRTGGRPKLGPEVQGDQDWPASSWDEPVAKLSARCSAHGPSSHHRLKETFQLLHQR